MKETWNSVDSIIDNFFVHRTRRYPLTGWRLKRPGLWDTASIWSLHAFALVSFSETMT